MKKKQIYWICQLGGWAFFVILNVIFFKTQINELVLITYLVMFCGGVIITHFFRFFIVKTRLLSYSILVQVPSVLIASLLQGIIFHFLIVTTVSLIFNKRGQINLISIVQDVFNFTFIFFFWSIIYFLIHFIINYKKIEITNLRYKANMNEIELNKLKSQLNPHFMFNAMNSIRALVDENPPKAKAAIIMLSNILRNTFMMEKNKLINFGDELKVVKDYLDLEQIRFEERLTYNFEVMENTKSFQVPTLMVQTLVENGIKHGISKLPAGGSVFLGACIKNEELHIQIKNSGKYIEQINLDTGFGIKSTKQRLEILFGDKSSFKIYNDSLGVVTEIVIPKY